MLQVLRRVYRLSVMQENEFIRIAERELQKLSDLAETSEE